MSLRNQPYLPLYVDDFLSDEKLVFCSASATGVYIRLMCLMHKSEEYGKILLKQKFKQSSSNLKNFASQLAVQLPYDYQTILFALEELVGTKVLQEEPCAISQRRMVKDNEISEKRAQSGKKGGDKSLGKRQNTHPENSEKAEDFALNFAQAKSQANYGNGIVNENEIIEEEKKEGVGGKKGEGEKAEPGKSEKSSQEFAEAEIVDELSFENVWALYERKGNRKSSKRRWEALPKKAKQLAIEHVPRYVATTPDIQYRKNFETYINQEAWNDEIICKTKNDENKNNSRFFVGAQDYGESTI